MSQGNTKTLTLLRGSWVPALRLTYVAANLGNFSPYKADRPIRFFRLNLGQFPIYVPLPQFHYHNRTFLGQPLTPTKSGR